MNARKRWGCDEPAIAPVFSITCPRCDGWEKKCEVCRGSGEKRLFRCPASFLDAQVVRLLDQYAAHQNGSLPREGAWEDQSVLFRRAVKVIEAERGAIRRDQAAQARRRSKRPKAKKDGGGRSTAGKRKR